MDQTKRWTNAAVWRWCSLDLKPSDAAVSRHELFPVRAPLKTLEHCIGDFLDGCDADDDHRISLAEWADCLGIEDRGEIEERCEEINAVQDE